MELSPTRDDNIVAHARSRKVAGWTALIAALAILLQIAAVLAGTGTVEERLSRPTFLVSEAIRALAELATVVGIHGWLQEEKPRRALVALAAGGLGASVVIASNALTLAGADVSLLDVPVFVSANVGFGLWLIIAGGIVSGMDVRLRRIGWAGQLGGAGSLLAMALLLVGEGPNVVGAQSWFSYAQVLTIFAIVFMVRLWRYLALGRLPDPGLI